MPGLLPGQPPQGLAPKLTPHGGRGSLSIRKADNFRWRDAGFLRNGAALNATVSTRQQLLYLPAAVSIDGFRLLPLPWTDYQSCPSLNLSGCFEERLFHVSAWRD